MREKVVRHRDPVEVRYDEERSRILASLRDRAEEVRRAFEMPSFVYGSVARGDVRHTSDVDIVLLEEVPSFKVEVALERAGLDICSREIVKASPNSVPKAHILLDRTTTVSFFLGPSTIREEEFYRFGGLLRSGDQGRVKGVDKRLLLIEPTPEGHIESGILDREAEVARALGIGVDVVLERVRVLSRRDRVGRTGVYLRRELGEEEGFEEVLKGIMDRDNITRRHMKGQRKR